MGELRGKVVSGAFWVTIERAATQAVDFVVGIVLARLLGPKDFGTVALTRKMRVRKILERIKGKTEEAFRGDVSLIPRPPVIKRKDRRH